MSEQRAATSSIRNIGPAMEARLQAAGITTAAELQAIGADQAYEMMLRNGAAPHFIAYYTMVMGLQNRPWNDAVGPEKDQLRARFDAIKSRIACDVPAGIETALNAIGTGMRR